VGKFNINRKKLRTIDFSINFCDHKLDPLILLAQNPRQ